MVERGLAGHLQAATRLYTTSADTEVIRACLSIGSYRTYLASCWGFEAGLEHAASGLRDRIEPRARWKSRLIAQDLEVLGLPAETIAKLPVCDVTGSVSDPVTALGWMFVSERKTSAHAVALFSLGRDLPFLRGRAVSYLEALRSKAGWQRLLTHLDQIALDPAISFDRVTVAAVDAFRTQRAWFLECRSALATEKIRAKGTMPLARIALKPSTPK
jgi:heme oxygenase